MKYSTILVAGILALGSAVPVQAASTPLALRYESNGVYIHGGVTSQTIETSFGTNLAGLAFTGTAAYDFYSPPLSMDIILVPSDKGGGVIYMQNTSSASANDFTVTGRMQYFDYDPVTGTDSLIVDTTASPSKDVDHGQIVNWAIPNALLPATTIIPAGHMIHVTMTIALVSGVPGTFGQVLVNGASGNSTVAYFPQNNPVILNWQISPGPMTPPAISSINTTPDPAVVVNFAGSPNGTYLVDATTNLSIPGAWITISTNRAGTNGLFQFIDSDARNYPCRFYRAKTP